MAKKSGRIGTRGNKTGTLPKKTSRGTTRRSGER